MASGQNEQHKWVQVHGWLLWAAVVLFQVGIILIRYSRPQRDPTATPSPKRARLLFYLHSIVMSVGVIAAITGIMILVAKVGTNWDYTHQRLGLSLLIIWMMQPFIGYIRPRKGNIARSIWFMIHFVFGTGALILGVINVYIGIRIYELIYKTSIRHLNIAFSILEVTLVFIYFLQDRWSYIIRQSEANLRMAPKTGVQRTAGPNV